MTPQEKPRWLYRFDNYQRAFLLLREAVDTIQSRRLTQLEKEGVIRRFEFTWELAWSYLALKVDVLAYDHITYSPLKTHIDEAVQVLFDRVDLGKL